MKFWPFPIVRFYREDLNATLITLKFAEAPDLEIVSNGRYYLVLRCYLGKLTIWNSHAEVWASNGKLETTGQVISWNNGMPSRYAVRQLKRPLARLRQQAQQAEYQRVHRVVEQLEKAR